MGTAQEIFERTMALMDRVEEDTGLADVGTNRPYKDRTLAILGLLGEECRDILPPAGCREGASTGRWEGFPDFRTDCGLDRRVTEGILPYGLAAHLLLEEDPAAASFYQQRYEELLARLRRERTARFEAIPSPYRGSGRWG